MKEDRLDISVFVLKFHKEKKIIIKIFTLFFLLTVIYAFFIHKKSYQSKIVFIPQVSQQSSLLSSLGGVAALTGINIGSRKSELISPLIYSKIITSKPFLDKMSRSKISIIIEGKLKGISYREYYKSLPVSFISRIKNIFISEKKKESHNNLVDGKIKIYSKTELNIFKSISQILRLEYNSKENIVSIESSFAEALPSSELVFNAVNILKDEIRIFKTQKRANELEFIEQRYEENNKKFKIAEIELASFEDKNQYLKSSRAKIKLLHLKSKYNLLFNICSELQNKIETKKIQLKEETPFISVIEPISIPTKKSGLRLSLILVIGLFLNLFIIIFYVFIKDFYAKVKNNLNSDKQ
ncbi:conserved hypothetical protein [Tenacibaculum dicentrarchi]|nr:conserved hypothetical protein [Tenacibaculum dicentrarchi]